MYIYICMRVYVCMCIYIYIYIHMICTISWGRGESGGAAARRRCSRVLPAARPGRATPWPCWRPPGGRLVAPRRARGRHGLRPILVRCATEVYSELHMHSFILSSYISIYALLLLLLLSLLPGRDAASRAARRVACREGSLVAPSHELQIERMCYKVT